MLEAKFHIARLMPHFAVEVTGVNLAKCADDDQTLEAIADVAAREGVVVVRDQQLVDEQQIAFSRKLGPLETYPKREYLAPSSHPEIAPVSNVDATTGELMPPLDRRMAYNDSNVLWHSDSSFRTIPAVLSLLSAREIPPSGGNTEFADMRIVWDELTDVEKVRVAPLVAEHSLLYSRKRLGRFDYTDAEKQKLRIVYQPIVRLHPVTGRRAIYVGSHIGPIQGLTPEESERLVSDLLARGTRQDRIYSHEWRPNDLVIWDNRSVLHRATPYFQNAHRRIMHRTTTSEGGPLIAEQSVREAAS